MTSIVIRTEGVNLASVLEDTNDLSTRRGAGLLLLEAANTAVTSTIGHAAAVSTGASASVLSASSEASARAAIDSIKQKLSEGDYAHFTFVTTAASAEDFVSAEAGALAAARWQQQRQLSLIVPQLGAEYVRHTKTDTSTESAVCALDAVRPATEDCRLPEGKQVKVSASVLARREFGRTARQTLYAQILNQTAYDECFTDDFQSLAHAATLSESDRATVGTLADKIAVIYADGNSFGDVGIKAAKSERLADWDRTVKGFRNVLLASFLKASEVDTRMRNTKDEIRLETLLWGGDEYIMVVPAWCGVSAWRLLYEQSRAWTYDAKALTHAYSVVFAHRSAPISRLVSLAKSLADQGKEHQKGRNSLTWTALESFDHMGLNLDDAMCRRYGDRVTWKDWVLSAEQALALDDFLSKRSESSEQHKDLLPRSQVVSGAISHVRAHPAEAAKRRQYATAQLRAKAIGGASAVDDLINVLARDSTGTVFSSDPNEKDTTEKQRAAFNAPAWVHLAEAWDYFGRKPLGVTTDAAVAGARS